MKPWCAGIGSGEATGWPVTDWLEDVMLRDVGPGRLRPVGQPRDPVQRPAGRRRAGPRSATSSRTTDYVNGGIGDVKSIATTDVPGRRSADPRRRLRPAPPGELLRRQLARGHQGGRGRRRLRLLPAHDQRGLGKPVLGGGEFVAAFNDGPEVQAFQTYLSTRHLGQREGQGHAGGGWVSANKGLDVNNLVQPDRQAGRRDPAGPGGGLPLRRLGPDARRGRRRLVLEGDARPGSPVRAPQETLDNIEKSWPQS